MSVPQRITREALAEKLATAYTEQASAALLADFYFEEHYALFSDPNRIDDEQLLWMAGYHDIPNSENLEII